jgi:MFS family permease
MLILLWLLYFSFEVVIGGFAPLVTPMLNDLNMLYGQMGFILGSWQLTYIAGVIIAGVIIDKWGIRKSLFAGALVMGLSATLRYFAIGFLHDLSGTFLTGAIYLGIMGMGIFALMFLLKPDTTIDSQHQPDLL